MTWMNSRIPAEQTSREWLKEQGLEKTRGKGSYSTWKASRKLLSLWLVLSIKEGTQWQRQESLSFMLLELNRAAPGPRPRENVTPLQLAPLSLN